MSLKREDLGTTPKDRDHICEIRDTWRPKSPHFRDPRNPNLVAYWLYKQHPWGELISLKKTIEEGNPETVV